MKKLFTKSNIAITLLAIFSATHALADEASVSKLVKQKFPKLASPNVFAVKENGIKGLYAVTVNGRIAYTNEDVTFIFTNGNLLSADTTDNLTSIHQQESNKRLFADFPKANAFKTVFGKGQRQLIIIEDADCPACKDFSKSIHSYPDPAKLNATVYSFPFALEKLHPDAVAKAETIWCSSTTDAGRSLAWKNWMTKGVMPQSKPCANPVKDNVKRFSQLGINATPTIMFSDGSALPGGIDIPKLIEGLDALDKSSKR